MADTRQRIIDATIAVIDAHGEPAVRVAKVANAAGVTQGMVTYHFETRDRLVAEAHAQRFGLTMNTDNLTALAAVENLTDVAQVRQVAHRMTQVVLSADRASARRVRATAIAYAISNEELRRAITVEHTRLIDEFTQIFDVLHGKGLLREGLEPRAIATMASAYTFGLVLADFDEQRPSDTELAAVIEAFLFGVLAD